MHPVVQVVQKAFTPVTVELSRTLDKLRGETRYEYEANGQLLARNTGRVVDGEEFRYDAAANRLNFNTSRLDHVKDNRLKQWANQEYEYDAWGNLIEKTVGIVRWQTFTYDCENRLVKTETMADTQVESTSSYQYDSLGRRVGKQSEIKGQTEHKHFLWQGLRMLREESPGQSSLYLYEHGSYAPLARVDQKEGEAENKVYYFHTDQIGTPLEMTDAEGQIVWQAKYRAWGAVEKLVVNEVEQNLRFQGQYFDAETGLHYNTFRYYDPEIGRFTTQDPIGLLGGENLYQYVKNPTLWIDPWGLCPKKDWGAYYSRATGTTAPSSMIRPHAHHIVFKGEFAKLPGMQKALQRSRTVLDKYKIDPIHDPASMMWAENRGHTTANAKLVASKLEEADKIIMAKNLPFNDAASAMRTALQKVGIEVFGN
ncbi:RHS repeat domain-containing protein [Pseudomonas tremae]|nr:RHS repeat-associated core domain-containing protein [Pseudomonas tremae]